MNRTIQTPSSDHTSKVSESISPNPKDHGGAAGSALFKTAIVAGILLRLLVVLIPGNGIQAPWSGGGDAHAYITLAQNMVAGQGYAYAGFPSAFRPPIYPGTLALFMELFGRNALRAMRLLQFFEGLGAVFFCGAAVGRVFGSRAKNLTILIALFFPMLVVLTGEIQTETIATLFSAIFLYQLVRFVQKPAWGLLITMAAVTGIATLTRPNMALFGFILVGVIFVQKDGLPKLRSAALATLVAGLVISPWVIRNEVVFHGQVFLSTQGGINAAVTMVTPQGRSQIGDIEEIQRVMGWVPPEQLETNLPVRLRLPSEPVLNDQDWKMAFKLWREAGWKMVPLELVKISYFWLCTDQMFVNGAFKVPVRLARQIAVMAYWVLLIIAAVGWFQLRIRMPTVAWAFMIYAVIVTILHLPFTMNARIGVPFIDPWVAMLAGAGVLHLASKFKLVESRYAPTAALEG